MSSKIASAVAAAPARQAVPDAVLTGTTGKRLLTKDIIADFNHCRRIHRAVPTAALRDKVREKLATFALPRLERNLIDFHHTELLIKCLVHFEMKDEKLTEVAVARLRTLIPILPPSQVARAFVLTAEVEQMGQESLMDAALPTVQQAAADFTPQDMAKVCLALASQQVNNETVWSTITEELKKKLHMFPPIELVRIAKSSVFAPEKLELPQLMDLKVAEVADQLDPSDLLQIVQKFQEHKLSCPNIEKVIAQSPDVGDGSVQSLQRLAQTMISGQKTQDPVLLESFLKKSLEGIDTLQMQGLGDLARRFTSTKVNVPELYERIASRAQQLSSSWTPNNLALFTTAFFASPDQVNAETKKLLANIAKFFDENLRADAEKKEGEGAEATKSDQEPSDEALAKEVSRPVTSRHWIDLIIVCESFDITYSVVPKLYTEMMGKLRKEIQDGNLDDVRKNCFRMSRLDRAGYVMDEVFTLMPGKFLNASHVEMLAVRSLMGLAAALPSCSRPEAGKALTLVGQSLLDTRHLSQFRRTAASQTDTVLNCVNGMAKARVVHVKLITELCDVVCENVGHFTTHDLCQLVVNFAALRIRDTSKLEVMCTKILEHRPPTATHVTSVLRAFAVSGTRSPRIFSLCLPRVRVLASQATAQEVVTCFQALAALSLTNYESIYAGLFARAAEVCQSFSAADIATMCACAVQLQAPQSPERTDFIFAIRLRFSKNREKFVADPTSTMRIVCALKSIDKTAIEPDLVDSLMDALAKDPTEVFAKHVAHLPSFFEALTQAHQATAEKIRLDVLVSVLKAFMGNLPVQQLLGAALAMHKLGYNFPTDGAKRRAKSADDNFLLKRLKEIQSKWVNEPELYATARDASIDEFFRDHLSASKVAFKTLQPDDDDEPAAQGGESNKKDDEEQAASKSPVKKGKPDSKKKVPSTDGKKDPPPPAKQTKAKAATTTKKKGKK